MINSTKFKSFLYLFNWIVSFSHFQADAGSKIPRDRSYIRSGNLTIKSLKKEDHGKYECVLENEIATLVASTLLLVNSKSARID